MIRTDDVVVTLSEDDAWTFLREQEIGRLAYHLVGEVHIVPINYVVTGQRLLFRTAPGSKLLGIVMNDDVAFEVDSFDRTRATSVIARGRAAFLTDREADAVRDLPLRSWLPTDKDEVVAIDVTEISGRAFRLDRRAAGSPA
jgi:nitroimidazol reductase NimA-like FMN-containing flavoprotein (pyridoxamine 5'-phosphate oxidase superfamily)